MVIKGIVWDKYGIIERNYSKESLEKELEKYTKIQDRENLKQFSITNSSMRVRQNKINILKEEIKKFKT